MKPRGHGRRNPRTKGARWHRGVLFRVGVQGSVLTEGSAYVLGGNRTSQTPTTEKCPFKSRPVEDPCRSLSFRPPETTPLFQFQVPYPYLTPSQSRQCLFGSSRPRRRPGRVSPTDGLARLYPLQGSGGVPRGMREGPTGTTERTRTGALRQDVDSHRGSRKRLIGETSVAGMEGEEGTCPVQTVDGKCGDTRMFNETEKRLEPHLLFHPYLGE